MRDSAVGPSSPLFDESSEVEGGTPGKTVRTSALPAAPDAGRLPWGLADAATAAPPAPPPAGPVADPFDLSFVRAGGEAGGLDGAMRSRAEQSLGVDLGGVRVHQGEQSAQASRDLGAAAFTFGQDVVLGGSASNDVNPVMAHELAHVAQQQGASHGVAAKAERGTQGSRHEVEADQAAGLIMMGAPARISQVGAEHVMCFEGAEHMDLGNEAWGGREITVGSVTLPAGVFTALQGDFFGTFEEMERACTDNPQLIYSYAEVLRREGDARRLHERDPEHHAEPDSNGAIMLASLLNGRSPMDYLDLAATNFNHFSERNDESNRMFHSAARSNPAYAAEINDAGSRFGHNIAQWLTMHLEAGKRAFEDGMAGRDLGGVGVAMDASAAHYLTDAFASGHMRVPRMEMYNEYQRVFRTAARNKVDQMVNTIPNTIDIRQFLTNAASSATSAARSVLPGWANSAIDTAAGAVRSGADALGVDMPSLPEMRINLAATKAAIKARLYPTCDTIGNYIGEKIAGFSAKVLHDYDNEHGVSVHNDAGEAWVARGDHALAASEDNRRIAVRCTGASANHIQQLHAAGQSQRSSGGGGGGAGGGGVTMPFISLRPIFSLLPQMDEATRNEGTEPGGPRDWHWATMNPTYRAQINQNAIESVRGTVDSAWTAIRDGIREEVESRVRDLLSGLGRFADMAAAKLGAIVDAIMAYIPTIDTDQLITAILAYRG